MGWALFRLNKREESLVFLIKAFQNYPDPEVAAHLGEVLWSLNQTTEAKTIWQNILQKYPNHKALLNTIERLAPALLAPPSPNETDHTDEQGSLPGDSTANKENLETSNEEKQETKRPVNVQPADKQPTGEQAKDSGPAN